MKLFVLIFVSAFCASLAQNECNVGNIMICYYASWGIYRPDVGQIQVENINPNLCTHLVYSFAGLDVINNAVVSLDPWNDFAENRGKDSYKKFVQLKEKNPCLKTLLAIGGWNEKSRKYSVMASTPESRNAFADKALRYIVQYQFDGLDFDWEYPGQRGGTEEDKANFVELLKILKTKFKPWELLLTVAVGVTENVSNESYDVKSIAENVDYVSLMTYDFVSANSPITGLLSPLKPKDSNDKTFTIETAINQWIEKGCTPEKIVVGIPFYARSFKLKNNKNTDIGAPTTTNHLTGRFTSQVGFLSIYELAEILTTNENYEAVSVNNYANVYTTNGTYWFTYDTVDTVIEKVNYVKGRGLGGVMAWSLDTDDFQGIFSDEPYPLLTAMQKALFG